jgi:hypothetical protein
LETVDGALLEDVTVTGISMRDIVSAPIFMRLGSRLRGPDGTKVGTLRRVIISDLVCSNASHRQGSIISGIPGYEIEDVKIANVVITHEGGGTKEDAAFQPPEYEDGYPEPTMFTANAPPRNGRSGNGQFVPEGAPAAGRGGAAGGRAPAAGAAAGGRAAGAAQAGRGNPPGPQHSMPSQGFYVRHVKGIQFDNIEIRTLTPDARPAFVLEDVQDADFFRVKVPHADGVPTFALKNVSGFGVHMCSGVKDTEIEKAESRVL